MITQKPQGPLYSVPKDILGEICRYLDPVSLTRFSLLCKRFFEFIQKNDSLRNKIHPIRFIWPFAKGSQENFLMQKLLLKPENPGFLASVRNVLWPPKLPLHSPLSLYKHPSPFFQQIASMYENVVELCQWAATPTLSSGQNKEWHMDAAGQLSNAASNNSILLKLEVLSEEECSDGMDKKPVNYRLRIIAKNNRPYSICKFAQPVALQEFFRNIKENLLLFYINDSITKEQINHIFYLVFKLFNKIWI